MGFNTYWNSSGFQQGGIAEEGPPGTINYVDGMLTVRASGPEGSVAINGGGYFTRYPDEGPSAFSSLVPVPSQQLTSSAPVRDQPNSWEVRAPFGAKTDGVLFCWVVVYEP